MEERQYSSIEERVIEHSVEIKKLTTGFSSLDESIKQSIIIQQKIAVEIAGLASHIRQSHTPDTCPIRELMHKIDSTLDELKHDRDINVAPNAVMREQVIRNQTSLEAAWKKVDLHEETLNKRAGALTLIGTIGALFGSAIGSLIMWFLTHKP